MHAKTAHPFKGCFAKHLGNCDGKSKEHYISKSILNAIGGMLSVKGLPWIPPGETRQASSQSLTASVLCKNHNSVLSGLDSEVSVLFSHLKNIDSKATPEELEEIPPVLEIDGTKLEKWLLKMLCGVMASGNFLIDGRSFGKISPSTYLVNLLYSSEPWKVGIGLNTVNIIGNRANAFRGIGYDPVTAKSGTHADIVGIDVHLWGFPLRAVFATNADGSALGNYRPSGLRIVNGTVYRDIVFSWPDDSPTSEMIVLTRDGTL